MGYLILSFYLTFVLKWQHIIGPCFFILFSLTIVFWLEWLDRSSCDYSKDTVKFKSTILLLVFYLFHLCSLFVFWIIWVFFQIPFFSPLLAYFIYLLVLVFSSGITSCIYIIYHIVCSDKICPGRTLEQHTSISPSHLCANIVILLTLLGNSLLCSLIGALPACFGTFGKQYCGVD